MCGPHNNPLHNQSEDHNWDPDNPPLLDTEDMVEAPHTSPKQAMNAALREVYEWLIQEPVYTRVLSAREGDPDQQTRVLVWDAGYRWAVILTTRDDGWILTNGQDIDYGNDGASIWGLVDAAIEYEENRTPDSEPELFQPGWDDEGYEITRPSNARPEAQG